MKKNKITFVEIILIVLALILTSVSFHQTWLGIEQLFGSAAIPLALVLSILLLLLDVLLRNAKLGQKPVLGLIAIYSFVAILCFLANFNALYTRFMKTDIYSQELKMLNSKFNELETNVSSKFNYKYPQETAQQVESKKKQLVEQIQDPGNLGIGDRAKGIIKDIEKLLGDKIDILSPVKNDYADLAIRMGKQIDSMVLNLSPQEAELKDEISRSVLKYNKKIQDLTINKNQIDNSAESLIQEALNEYNKLGGRSQSVLTKDKFEFTTITSKTSEIGKIGFAFSHAWEHFGIYPIVVFLGCLVLDFLIPILIILIVKGNENKDNTGPVIRTGKTIGFQES
jgi:hypothetical protein